MFKTGTSQEGATAGGRRPTAAGASKVPGFSDSQYRLFFENMQVGAALHEIICDAQGRPVDYRYLSANPAFERLTGLSVADLVGKTVLSVLPGLEPHWIERFGRVALTGEPAEFQNHAAELGRWYSVRAWCPEIGTFAVTFQDITDRVLSEQALRESEQRYRELAEHLPETVFEADPDGKIAYINPAGEQLLGYARRELEGIAASMDLVAPEDRARAEVDFAAVLEGQPGTVGEYGAVHRDGHVIPVLVHPRRILRDGKPAGVRGIIIDLTERKRAEEDRRRLESQLLHAQKLESLGVLAGGIAHDFNNLLMVILGYTRLAIDELPQASPVQTSLMSVEKASREAADLCRQMLAFAGRGRLAVAPVALNDIVKDTTHLLSVAISKGATLTYALEADLPMVNADVTQMRQVLMNLVTNASEALNGRTGVIRVVTGVEDCDEAGLRSLHAGYGMMPGRYVYMEVEDSGCGMAPEVVARIFDPFFTTKSAGRGLGMASVLGIVRGHSGGVRVTSQPGRGTRIRILLPASREIEEGSAQTPLPLEAPERRWKGTVLVVDDEESVRNVLSMYLSRMGFSVLTAADGSEGVAVWKTHGREIVCIVLDLTMKEMNGDVAAQEIRRGSSTVPIIISSGFSADPQIERQFAGKPTTGFLGKPYKPDALHAELRRLLG